MRIAAVSKRGVGALEGTSPRSEWSRWSIVSNAISAGVVGACAVAFMLVVQPSIASANAADANGQATAGQMMAEQATTLSFRSHGGETTREEIATLPLEGSISEDSNTYSRPDTNTAAEGAEAGSEERFDLASTLESIRFERGENGREMVVAEMNAAGVYTFERTAPSEYVLTLENASLSDTTAPTLLAPRPNSGIRSARTVSDGQHVQVRLFTRPNVALSTETRGSTILVGEFENSQLTAYEDQRAQYGAENSGEGDAAAGGEGGDDLAALLEDGPKYTGRLISLDLQDTDIDNALRIIAEVSNLNIIASDDVTGKVTLRLVDVPWDQALDVILKTNGLDKVQEGNVMRIAPVEKLRQEREALKQAKQAEEELEPLAVKYIRVSYAKASDLKPLVETVLSERGTVTHDERTNQLIVKDIRKGIKNVALLVAKLDLRTPQVLLETQIVEAKRSLVRDLGSQLGFDYIRSPDTGNATGYNFPNSIEIGGGNNGLLSDFPAAISPTEGFAIDLLLGSADGSKNLLAQISALEQDGSVRVVSRPTVVTTNNKPALIKSVEKIRVKLPSGGTSVATGQGASASGGSTATETIEIGITLEVTPQASPDYYVLLDVNAKSSTFGAQEVDGIPSEVERSSTSTVLVSSGQTFVMGGIYKISDTENLQGVPFLKDIPFFGYLFRESRVDSSDEELIFFLTPRIVEGSFDDAAMRSS